MGKNLGLALPSRTGLKEPVLSLPKGRCWKRAGAGLDRQHQLFHGGAAENELCERERLILNGYLLHGTPPGRGPGAAAG